MDHLLPQLQPGVEILVCYNSGGTPLGEIRQELMGEARGRYLSFVDDDDLVPHDFVASIMPALEQDVDVVGFEVEYTANGGPPRRCFCSLRTEPRDDPDGTLYRDLTHVQPVRSSLAQLGDFRAGWPEDNTWRNQVRPLLQTECYVDRVLYFYRHNTADSVQNGQVRCDRVPPEDFPVPGFRYMERP